ncbi:MAG: histidine kinase [Cyanobacteria bacterium P01_A01_bin.135]
MAPQDPFTALPQSLQMRIAELEAENQRLRQSERRYRTLFELSNECISRYEIDPPIDISLPVEEQVRLLYQNCWISEVNTTLLDQFGYQSAADVVGKRLREFDPPCCLNSDSYVALIRNGYQIRNAESAGPKIDTQRRYFLSNIVGDVRDGYLWGGWGMCTDITEFKQIQQEREQVAQQRAVDLEVHNHRLSSRDRILEATATAANALLTNENLDAAVNTALRIIGEGLGTDRIAIIEAEPFDESANLSSVGWQCLYEWRSDYAVSQSSYPGYSQGNSGGIEAWLEPFLAGQSISYLLEEMPEPFRSLQAALGVKVLHAVPIFVEGQWWGALGIDDCREAKRRAPAELAVLKTAAACIGSAIKHERLRLAQLRSQEMSLAAEQARSQELAQLNIELQRTLDCLAASEKRFRELFEASYDNICFLAFEPPIPLDLPVEEQLNHIYSASRLTDVNPACERELGLSRSEMIGRPLTVIRSPDSDGHRSLVRRMIENGWQITNAESEDTDANGQKRYWLNNLFTTVEQGCVVRGWGVSSNITALRQAQEALAEERLQTETALIRERTRIAQEIHDTLAQTFTGITVQLELAQYLVEQHSVTDAAPLTTVLDRIGNLAKTGLAEARRSVWAIYPANEAQGNLTQDIPAIVDKLTNGSDIQTEVFLDGEPHTLSHFASKHLVRIAQEAITNALKHAQANHLWITLICNASCLHLSIRDNGCGFLPQHQTGGFGLVSMSERANQIGGELRIYTQPGEGTEVIVEVTQ